MKTIILAAGLGNRLGHHDLPKPLTPLADGKSILEHQLSILSRHVSMDDVIVVVGYHKEMIMEMFPNLLYLFNPDYTHENTAKSLLRALKKCEEDILWLNGDVLFHPSVLAAILALPRTSMVVNASKANAEAVKYRQDSEGKISTVSKEVTGAQGEALGINYCTKADLSALRVALEYCQKNDYYERALEMCIRQGMAVWSVQVNDKLCTEIDFPEDLDHANKLLKSW